MKRLPFLLLAIVLVSACKKSDDLKEFRSTIAGTWEYERSLSFEGPPNQPSLPLGNGKLIVIGEDGSFERKQHDTTVFEGTYTLQKKEDCSPRTTNVLFQTNEYTSGNESYIELENNKLTLSTPNCWADGGINYYRKIK